MYDDPLSIIDPYIDQIKKRYPRLYSLALEKNGFIIGFDESSLPIFELQILGIQGNLLHINVFDYPNKLKVDNEKK